MAALKATNTPEFDSGSYKQLVLGPKVRKTSSLYLNEWEADTLNYCLTVIFSKRIPRFLKQSHIVLGMTNEKLQQCSDLLFVSYGL